MSVEYVIGDSLEIMRTYPDNSFDIVFTSPPFKDEDVPGEYWQWYDEFFHEAYRVAGKVLIIIHSATKMQEHIVKYPCKRILIWGKGQVKYAWRYNPIYVYQKTDEYKINKYIWSDVFGVAPLVGSQKSHVYQDPLLLYTTILKMFKGCINVLDPFGGSGTTGKACKELQLDCTLIEIDSQYSPLIKERIGANIPELSTFEVVL